MSAGTKLVIVESPTKARTIRKFLGNEYRVEASMGHVRDLPAKGAEVPEDVKGKSWSRLGVDVENGFQPIYVIPGGKKKVVSELRKAVKEADELFLATDEDREGESIGWHLVEVLKPKIPIRRMVFHEITKTAIQEALAHPRELNTDLVNAQETRRVLDRLVGYVVSPLLWKKVAPKLSAGRVQSVAVRLLVMRERERMAFKSGTYWDLKARLAAGAAQEAFEAQLVSLDGTRIASGKDFDENTGKIPEGKNVLLLEEAPARELAKQLTEQAFKVVSREVRHQTRSPLPPFTTSTLQQESNRKLGLSANRTMRIAQRLYEQGHITYMRTDSLSLSKDAVAGIRKMVSKRYGDEYLSKQVREYKTESKGAQEAHEAIRPAGTEMPTAEELGLTAEQAKLYDLIWKRTVACQMAEAQLAFTTVQLEARAGDREALFRASGREVTFPGFFRAYVEGSEDPDEALEDQSQPLPMMEEGQSVSCQRVEPLGHDTKPPARYTEASLVKALEANGIGRPSTYASIIGTIQARGYVEAKGKQLVPTFTAMAVTQLLEAALEPVVDLAFTALMEERLDKIAEGQEPLPYLEEFYNDQLIARVDSGMAVDAREVCKVRGANYGKYEVRVGRYGAFVEYPLDGPEGEDGEVTTATVSLPEGVAPGDVDEAFLDKLVALAKRGRTPVGEDPDTGKPVFVLVGPFGPYVQLGVVEDPKSKKNRPKRVSIPTSMDPLEVDLNKALALLALPRKLGEHPETGKNVRAGIGRYGPYVVHETVYASLKAEDDVLTVDLDRALELLAGKKPRRRASDPLKELGKHPEDQEPVLVMNGPYGAYVKHGKLNASVPEGFDVEDITMDEAVVWLEEKAAKKGLRTGGKVAKAANQDQETGRKAAAKTVKKKASKKKATKKKAVKKKATAKKSDSASGDGSTEKKKVAKKVAKKTAKKSSKKKAKKKTSKKAAAQAPAQSVESTSETSE